MMNNVKAISLSSEQELLTNIEFNLNMDGADYTFLIQKNRFDKLYYMSIFHGDETILATGILLTQYNNLLAGEIIGGWEMYVRHKIDPDKNRPVDTEYFNEWNIVYGHSV